MKTKRNFIVSGSLLALFVAYTLVVAFVDVREIGAGFTVVGRLYSGVHWLTDIIGGIILSAALESFYYSFVALHARKCD